MANTSPLIIDEYLDNVSTLKQSNAYNALLTQLAKIIASLQVNVLSNPNLDKQSNAVVCWQYLLNDLMTVVLPEFYVVFYDNTTKAVQRRRLYDITQALYFAMVACDKPIFLQKIALCDIQTKPLNTAAPSAQTYYPHQIDSYPTGEGDNVKTAYALQAIADYIDVDGFYYLDKFEAYANLLLSEKALLSYLQNNTLDNLQQMLQKWQQWRYVAFSFLNQGRILPSTLNANHALAVWMLNTPHIKHSRSHTNDVPSHDALKEIKNYAATVVTSPSKLKKGLLYSGSSLVLFTVMGMHPATFIILSIFFLTSAKKGAVLLNDSINYERYILVIKEYGILIIVLAIVTLFFGGIFTGIGVNILFIAYFIYEDISKHEEGRRLIEQQQTTPLVNNSVNAPSVRQRIIKNNNGTNKTEPAEAQSGVTSKSYGETPAKNYDLPLDINRHAYHLAILLSESPTTHLKQLITSANILHSHIDYLQTSHPYLAARVQEFIKDLTHNTLVRLDEMASHFVTEGQVHTDAKALFIEQHEARIDALLTLNLSQIDDLNKTILEKKMAGFSQVGNQAERDFRDLLMELKILLRWLIVQQPDEIQATSHQVILDNLESSTLADMQSIFFAPQTTDEQRGELQQQLIRLLTHFKQQTTQHIHLNSPYQDDAEMQALLQLSKPDHKTADGMDIDTVTAQATKQQFIEFNKHYINQILMHWH